MPRVTPVIPPILEAKSNQVIFSALENSAREGELETTGERFLGKKNSYLFVELK